MTALESYTTHSEGETGTVARRTAAGLSAGDVVLLYGDLGAGKTAFVRGLAEGLGIDPDDVSSPTFTLIQEYRGGRLPLYHVDLYRLNDPREIDDLGLEEIAVDGVLAIEWAEKLRQAPPMGIAVRIEHRDANTRTIQLTNSPTHQLTNQAKSRSTFHRRR